MYVSSRISREVVFLLIGPFISLLAALSIPVFGWQKRQDALSYLWSCLRRPGEFVIKALLFLSVYFIWICLLVSIVPFFISVGEVFARRGEVNLYISVALLGLGVLSFWYAQRTVPTMLIDRLVETNWPLEVRIYRYNRGRVGYCHHRFDSEYDRSLRSLDVAVSLELSGDRTANQAL